MYKQNHGRGPMMKTGHGLPEGMTSPLKQVKVEKPKDARTGSDMVDVNAFSEGQEPYSISVKKGSAYAKMGEKIGAIPNNLRPGNYSASTDPLATGISPEEKKARRTLQDE